jgi:Na+/proline symporter
MWLRDIYKPYIRYAPRPRSRSRFGHIVAVIDSAISITLVSSPLRKDCQTSPASSHSSTLLPVHVAPVVWLGLHWDSLRGEAVAAGMLTRVATIGLVFTSVKMRLTAGLDQVACGLSTAMICSFVNLTETVLLVWCCSTSPTSLVYQQQQSEPQHLPQTTLI